MSEPITWLKEMSTDKIIKLIAIHYVVLAKFLFLQQAGKVVSWGLYNSLLFLLCNGLDINYEKMLWFWSYLNNEVNTFAQLMNSDMIDPYIWQGSQIVLK